MSQQINLYNPLFLKKEKHFSARAMLQALGLVALGTAALYGYALWETRASARLAAEYRAQVDAQRAQLARLAAQSPARGPSSVLEAEAARLQAAVKARQSVLASLGTEELGSTDGFSGYFAAFGRQAMPGVWLTGFAIGEGGGALQLSGRALHPDLVPAYLRALNAEAVMRGRQVVELRLQAKERGPAAQAAGAAEPERYVEFSLSAPVRAPEPRRDAKKEPRP